MLPACDISQYQGVWQDYPCDIVLIKMTGGDNGLYPDPDAGANFNGAQADGKHIGGYHFVGWTEGAVQEASYFVNFTRPLTENQVYMLDCENGAVAVSASSPAYANDMANYIHDTIGVWPLIYMNLSTLNSYDWSAVLANCGLVLAYWNGNSSGVIPTTTTYVMQQYADGPVYDHDEWFGTLDEFDAYGYHATPTPTPAPEPPTPVPTPVPPAPTPVPVPKPTPKPTPKPPVKLSLIQKILKWLHL